MKPLPHEDLVALARTRIQVLDPLDRGLSPELVDDVALGARDRERLANRATALRHDRARVACAFEDRADRAFAHDLVVL